MPSLAVTARSGGSNCPHLQMEKGSGRGEAQRAPRFRGGLSPARVPALPSCPPGRLPPSPQWHEEVEGSEAAAGGGCADVDPAFPGVPQGPHSGPLPRVLGPACRRGSATQRWTAVLRERRLFSHRGPLSLPGTLQDGQESCRSLTPSARGPRPGGGQWCPQQCSCAKELLPSQHAVLDLTNLPTKLNRGGRS